MSKKHASPKTLAEALAIATAKLTILDDRTTIEDAAVFRWLKGHQLRKGRFHNLVVGSQALPPGWQAQTKKFGSEILIADFLRPIARDPVAMRALRDALVEAVEKSASTGDADIVKQAAKALATGKLWAIEAEHAPQRWFISRTTPTVFATINPQLGTAVDFAYIAKLEGDQWLRGYIPVKGRTGIVAGRSGMTVASGFDIGQWSASDLSRFGFPPALLAKLKPFTKHPFKGLSKEQVAAKVAKLGPVPILTKAEADLCDRAVFLAFLTDAQRIWNDKITVGVVRFEKLPAGWQTIWLSRFYQEGSNTHVAKGIVFRRQALAGKWTDAIATLRSYREYHKRAIAEADVLVVELPPDPLPKPTEKAK